MLYVSDNVTNCVHKFTITGDFVSKFATDQQDKGILSEPRGICVSHEGRIFVAEQSQNRISVFKPDGTFAHHIKGSSSDGSALSSPWGVALDPKGNLHVTNFNSTNIVIFTPEGNFVSKYSYSVSQLTGIALDEEGYSFIAEHKYDSRRGYYGKLHVFGPLHQYLHTLSNLKYARGVAIDRDGYLYVATAENRIYKY